MKTLMFIGLTIFVSSCMHLGMVDVGSHDGSSDMESSVEKEVVAGNVRVNAVIPQLRRGRESLITIRVEEAGSGRPIRGATVDFHQQFLHDPSEGGMDPVHSAPHRTDVTRSPRPEARHDVNIDTELTESRNPGIFVARAAPSSSGEYRLMFHVAVGEEGGESREVVLETRRTVLPDQDAHSGDMHESVPFGRYALLGAFAMGAMMLLVWAI